MVRHSKPMSLNEKILRGHRSTVKYFKEWCGDNGIIYASYDEAEDGYICVISLNDYDIHEYRKNISEDNESFFLSEEDYETWCEHE